MLHSFRVSTSPRFKDFRRKRKKISFSRNSKSLQYIAEGCDQEVTINFFSSQNCNPKEKKKLRLLAERYENRKSQHYKSLDGFDVDGLDCVSNHPNSETFSLCSSNGLGCAESFMQGDFSAYAIHMAQSAEEFVKQVWLRGWRVVGKSNLPAWLRDNEFLMSWHRPELNSFKACFNSIFRIHSETGNIWTHFLGCLMFISMALFFLFQPCYRIHLYEKIVFGVYYAGASICLFLSFLFHTMFCHSERICGILSKLDYCGIATLTVGSFVPWLHYSFYCDSLIKTLYMVSVSFLGSICVVVSMFNRFATPKYRPLRALVFILLGLSGLVPGAHYMIINGFVFAFRQASLGWLLLMAALYISGALIYALQVPERFFPGKMDLWGQSHQIFHLFVVIAALVHHHGIVRIAEWRLSHGDCQLEN